MILGRYPITHGFQPLGNTAITTDGEVKPEHDASTLNKGMPYPADWDPSWGWVIEHADEEGQYLPIVWNETDPDAQETVNKVHVSWPCHKIDDKADAWLVHASWMSLLSVHVGMERSDGTVSTDLDQLEGGLPYRAQDSSHVHGREVQREAQRRRHAAVGQKDWEPEDDNYVEDPANRWGVGETARFGWYLSQDKSIDDELTSIPLVSTRDYPNGTQLDVYTNLACIVDGKEEDGIRVGRKEDYEPADLMTDAGEIRFSLTYEVRRPDGTVVGSLQAQQDLPLIPADLTGAWPLTQMAWRSALHEGRTVWSHYREGYLHYNDLLTLTICHETIDLQAAPDGPLEVVVTVDGHSISRYPARGLYKAESNLNNSHTLICTDAAIWEKPS